MNKLHINCGNCGHLKGCEIRAAFTESMKTIKDLKKTFNTYTHNETIQQFHLKCPLKTPKYPDGTMVKFTVGYGRHIVETRWECNLGQCDEGCNKGCVDGFITFKNTRYKGYVEITGKIFGCIKHNKYIIDVDYKDIDWSLFNDLDKKVIDDIGGKFGSYITDEQNVFFVSKINYIKEIKL